MAEDWGSARSVEERIEAIACILGMFISRLGHVVWYRETLVVVHDKLLCRDRGPYTVRCCEELFGRSSG